MTDEHWDDPGAKCFGMLLDGRAQPTGIRRRGQDATLLIVFNAHHDVVEFSLPEAPGGARWVGLVDTSDPSRTDPPSFGLGHVHQITARSLPLLARKSGVSGKSVSVSVDIGWRCSIKNIQ